MSVLDLLIVLVIIASVATGFAAGFARVGIGFLATIFGLVFGFWFYGYPAAFLHQFIHSTTVSNILGFFIVFLAFLAAGAVIGNLIAKVFKWTGLSWIDKLLGAVFGFFRGALFAVIVVTVLMAFIPRKPLPNWVVQSKVLPYAVSASDVLASMAPASIKNAFRESLEEIHTLWDQQLERAEDKLRNRREKDRSSDERAATPPPQQNPEPQPKKSQRTKKKKEDSNVGRSFDF